MLRAVLKPRSSLIDALNAWNGCLNRRHGERNTPKLLSYVSGQIYAVLTSFGDVDAPHLVDILLTGRSAISSAPIARRALGRASLDASWVRCVKVRKGGSI